MVGEEIGYAAGLYRDESCTLEIAQIQKANFIKSNEKVLNLGFSNANDWIKFKFYNSSNRNLQKVLKINWLLISEVELFYQVNGGWTSVKGGVEIPKSKQPIAGLNIFLPFILPANDTASLYLLIKSHNAKVLPISIIDQGQVQADNNMNYMILGGIIGAIMIISLYNLFLGFSTRDSLYFIYSFANLFVLLSILAEKGYYYYFLPEQFIYLAPIFTPVIYGMCIVLSAIFGARLLELKSYVPKVYYGLFGVIALAFLNIIIVVSLRFSGGNVDYQSISFGTLICVLVMIYAGVSALKKGSPYAKFYLFGWSALLVGVILLMLTLNGVFPANQLTKNTYVIGSICELLIFSFALAERFNKLKREKEQLRTKLVNTESDLNVVISDNQLRHRFSGDVLLNLEEVLNEDDANLRQKLKGFIQDVKLQSEVEKKLDFEQQNFRKLDGEFKRKLGTKFPELSTSEIEVLMLMRMNLSIKEIVRVRNSSESAIKSVRYRIRKKNNLSLKEIINLTL